MTAKLSHDVLVVGAGPAGLSAALVLGRCRRRVLVLDAGQPRNAAAHSLHGFLSRDGVAPAELLRLGREQLRPYDGVELRRGTVTDARPLGRDFEVRVADGGRFTGRRLLLATGVVDRLPAVPGVEAFYGQSVFHCPYCDGWEVRDQPLAVYGQGTHGLGLARTLLGWSRDLVLCTDGPARLPAEGRGFLARHGVAVRQERVERLEGAGGRLERVVLAGGEALPCRALFFNTGQHQRSALPARLGCKIKADDAVVTDDECQTTVPGVYLAGDASRDVQLAVVAAAEGARAAFAINKALLDEDGRAGGNGRGQPAPGRRPGVPTS